MDAQDLVDRCRQQRRSGAKALLHLGVCRQVLDQYPHRSGNRPQLTDSPVAQDADDLLVDQLPALDGFVQQMRRHIVGSLIAQLAPVIEDRTDVAVVLTCQIGHRGPVTARSRRLMAPHPAIERFQHGGVPAHERTLDAQCEGACQHCHHLDLTPLRQRGHGLARNLPTHGLEGPHRICGEVGLHHAPEARMTRRIHAVWHRDMTR